MANKVAFLPLTPDPQNNDVAFFPNMNAQYVNFVPLVVSPAMGGQKQIKLKKRRGFYTAFKTVQANYLFDAAIHWTGLPSTSTFPSTVRGSIAYTMDRPGTNLRLYSYGTAEVLLGTFGTANYYCIGMQETLISNVANLTMAVRNSASPFDQKLLFFPNTGALTEVTDGDFPASTFIGNPVHMDGYCFIATTAGTIWNSDINSLSAWTSTSFISAQSVPDSLVGLARIKNLVLGLGTRSIEFFQNAGNASGSPLQRIDSAALKIGVLHQLAAQEIGEALLFVSVSADGVGVHILNGTTATKVSKPYIDIELAYNADSAGSTPLQGDYKSINNIYFCGLTNMHGVPFAVLNIGDNFWCYAPSLDQWMLITLGTDPGIANHAFFFEVGAQNFVMDRGGTSGTIAYCPGVLSPASTGADSIQGQTLQFTASVFTFPLTHGTTNFKTFNSIEIVGDLQTTTTPVIVQYLDNNTTVNTLGTIEMSVSPPAKLTRAGRSRKRQWLLTNTSAGGCAIDAVRAVYNEGTS